MDAQDRSDMHAQMESLLLAAGPLLRTRPGLFRQAAVIFAAIVTNTLRTASAHTVELFNAGLDLHHGAAPPAAPPAAMPAWVAAKFPFAPPTPLLRDQIHQIEAMLAPLSDKRTRAHHIGLRLGACRAATTTESPGHEIRTQ